MNIFRKLRYNNKAFLTTIIFLTALLPSVVMLLLYYRSEHNSVTDHTLIYEEHLCEDACANFQFLLDQFDQVQYEVTNQFISLGIDKINHTGLMQKDLERIRIFENQLQSIRRTIKGINNIYVIDLLDEGYVYSSTFVYLKNTLLQKQWLKRKYTSSQTWSIIGKHAVDYLGNGISAENASSCFTFLTGLVNKSAEGEFRFVLQIDIMDSYLEELATHFIPSEEAAALITLGESVLYCSNGTFPETIWDMAKEFDFPEDEYAIRAWGNKYFSHMALPQMELEILKLIDPIPEDTFSSLALQIGMLVAVIVLISILLAAYIARSFTQPFESLIRDTVQTLKDTSHLQEVQVRSKNEDVVIISEHFNTLIRQLKSQMKHSVEQEAEKRKLQMRMLQAQINPHFLYNTLNSIKWMALMRQEKEIAETISALVDLLDYSCKGTGTLVTLQDEVRFLKDYVEIQRLRTMDKNIEVLYDLDDVLQYKIIKLSLQPALENAFLHAFPSEISNPSICISGKVHEDTLSISITDNGIGFDTSAIRKNMTGIGIKNVDERIQLQFGPKYGLSVQSVIGSGTTVTITFPTIL